MVRSGRDVAVDVLLGTILRRITRYDVLQWLVLVVSELYLGNHVPEATHFLDRERLQLKQSHAVVVVAGDAHGRRLRDYCDGYLILCLQRFLGRKSPLRLYQLLRRQYGLDGQLRVNFAQL